MRFLYDAGGNEDFIHCPVCGRQEFGYEKVDYPVTKLKCLGCGAVTTFKKPVRELKPVGAKDGSVQPK